MSTTDRVAVRFKIVTPEQLGWTRAPHLDQGSGDYLEQAYIQQDGAPYLFPPGQQPALEVALDPPWGLSPAAGMPGDI